MFYTHDERMYAERAIEGREGAQIPLHSDNYRGELVQPQDGSSSESETNNDGTWGENEQGGPVNCTTAMHDYEDLRHQLTHLSRTRSQKSAATARKPSALKRTITNASRRSRATAGEDIEAHEEEEKLEEVAAEDEDEFVLGDFLRDGHFEKRNTRGSAKKVGVIYKNLTVQGVGATSTYVKTLPSAIMGVSISLFQVHKMPQSNLYNVDFRTRLVQVVDAIHPCTP